VFCPFLRKISGVVPKPEVLSFTIINVETHGPVFIFFSISAGNQPAAEAAHRIRFRAATPLLPALGKGGFVFCYLGIAGAPVGQGRTPAGLQ